MWEGPQRPESEPDSHYCRAEAAPTFHKKKRPRKPCPTGALNLKLDQLDYGLVVVVVVVCSFW